MNWKPTFEPKALVTFTYDEVRIMMECSKAHYDGYCRSISSPGLGSFLYGMSHQLGDTLLPPMQYCLTFREINTLAKVLEGCGHLPDGTDIDNGRKLEYRLRRILGALNEMKMDGIITPRSLLQSVLDNLGSSIPEPDKVDAVDALFGQIQKLLKS